MIFEFSFLYVNYQTLLISTFNYGKILFIYGEVAMKKIAKLIIALILIYIILVTSVADINHGMGGIL